MNGNERKLIFKSEIYAVVKVGFIEPIKKYSPVHFF